MLGDNIKRIMKLKNISSRELAEKAGITKTYLSYIINNKRKNPTIELLDKIANVLNVTIDDLFKDAEYADENNKSDEMEQMENEVDYIISEIKKDPSLRKKVAKIIEIFKSENGDI